MIINGITNGVNKNYRRRKSMEHQYQDDDFLHKVREKMSKDYFAISTGVEIVKAAPGYAMTKLNITKQHLNSAGIVQGGVLFTMADYTLASATNYGPQVALSIECQLSFIRSADKGVLWAETELIGDTKSFANYAVKVTNEQSQIVAHFYGRVYKLNKAVNKPE